MYTTSNTRMDDRAELLGLMRQYSFATLITSRADGPPRATHLPILVDESTGDLRLVAHLARANPQWRDFAKDREALAVFQGPHAYISPSLYIDQPSVPTWDYLAVHASGPVRIAEDDGERRVALKQLVEAHDPAWLDRFATLPADYLDRKLAGIVAFTMQVTRLEGRWKLSQERRPDERSAIIQSLAAGDDAVAHELAARMREPLP